MGKKEIIKYQDKLTKEITTFVLAFEANDGGGYSFPCDEDGNIAYEALSVTTAANAKQCIAGVKSGIGTGKIRSAVHVIKYCKCGSKETPFDVCDARNIYIGKACSKCEKTLMGKFRPDIFTDSQYPVEEQIDED